MFKLGIRTCLVSALCFFIVPILSELHINSTLVTILYFGSVVIGLLLWYMHDWKKADIAYEKAVERNEIIRNFAVFTNSNHELLLKKQGEGLGYFIAIKPVMKYDVSYVPEELVYTSATVGGITTGGVHRTGNYNKISDMRESGKYELRWLGENCEYVDGSMISTIKLDDEELVKSARKNPTIKQFLHGKKLLLFHENKQLFEDIPFDEFNTTMGYNKINANHIATALTYQECSDIRNWLCNEKPL